jgi:hypothetical protein
LLAVNEGGGTSVAAMTDAAGATTNVYVANKADTASTTAAQVVDVSEAPVDGLVHIGDVEEDALNGHGR